MRGCEKEVWWIRHGHRQDAGDALSPGLGLSTLSEDGWREARLLAAWFSSRPDLIVASPFLRAIQTAAPLMEKYSDVPTETWPAEELTVLPHARFCQTNFADRAQETTEFWLRDDAEWSAGGGAESFFDFIGRIDRCLEAGRRATAKFIVVFSHGYTIKALLWRLANPGPVLRRGSVRAFYHYQQTLSVPTVSIVNARLDSRGIWSASPPQRPELGKWTLADDARE